MRNKNQSGFTLIELLVVIAIIGLLASVVLLALNSARAKSRDAKRLADVRQIASAMELFFNDYNSYPTNNITVGTFNTLSTTYAPRLSPQYIGLVPTAPNPSDGTCTATQNSYQINGTGVGTNVTSGYMITFCIGGDTGGYSAGVHTLTQAGIQ